MSYKDATVVNSDVGLVKVYPPIKDKWKLATGEWPASLELMDGTVIRLGKSDAETVASTIAPQLFPEEGTEPWRTPIRETYADLAETVQSYTRDLSASKAGSWDEEAITESLSGLLEALNGTLDRLEKLL